MYSLAEFEETVTVAADPLLREIATILELRERVLRGSDYGYLSPLARTLVEREIPRLVELLAERGLAPRL